MAPETGKLVKMDMRSVDRMEITKKMTAAPGEMWKGQIEGAALLRRPARQIFNFLSLIDPLQRQQDKQQSRLTLNQYRKASPIHYYPFEVV